VFLYGLGRPREGPFQTQEGHAMPQLFDIFKIGEDGKPLWIEAAETLDAAKTIVKQLLTSDSPVEYVIFNQQTQDKISIQPNVL
jgi:hypothetical protein